MQSLHVEKAGACNLVAHQFAETLIRSSLVLIELGQMSRRRTETSQLILRKIDAPMRQIPAYIAQNIRELHSNAQMPCRTQSRLRARAQHVGQRQPNSSSRLITIEQKLLSIGKDARLQIGTLAAQEILEKRQRNIKLGKNLGEP